MEYFRVLVGQQAPPSALAYLDQPRALFFDKLLSVVAIFSYRNYWIASVYLSLLSFGGVLEAGKCAKPSFSPNTGLLLRLHFCFIRRWFFGVRVF